jgi:hypothetical protein
MDQLKFNELRQPIKDKILKWFSEHTLNEGPPCRYCIWDRMWIEQETYQPIHKCLKSGKNEGEILGLGFDGKLIENYIKISNCGSELKNDLIFLFIQHPLDPISKSECKMLYKRIQDADADDYVCLHFDPRPDGEISTAAEME